MFDPNSRYHTLPVATFVAPDGTTRAYVTRRFLPQGSAIPVLGEVVTTEGERLDLLAARALGDPEQFWRVCDANDAMDPAALVAEPGRRVTIPVPQF